MRWKPAALTIIGRLLHAALVLTLTTLLFKTVYHAFFLLSAESTTPAELTLQAGRGGNQRARGPAPEEIVRAASGLGKRTRVDVLAGRIAEYLLDVV